MTTLFGNNAITTATPFDAPPPRKKRGWLPLLTVLFCISYGLMTMLIVEQGATIESQRTLIRELFRDSTELSAVKQKALQNKAAAGVHAPPSPDNQVSTQAPLQQTPSSQAAQQNHSQKQVTKPKPQFRMPSKPAADLSDDRRALITI